MVPGLKFSIRTSAFVFSADDLMATLGPRPRVYAADALDLLDESAKLCLGEGG